MLFNDYSNKITDKSLMDTKVSGMCASIDCKKIFLYNYKINCKSTTLHVVKSFIFSEIIIEL